MKKSSKRDQQNSNYVRDFLNWQDNQYNPGYYIGSSCPMDAKYVSRKMGSCLLLQAFIMAIGLAVMAYYCFSHDFVVYNYLLLLFISLVFVLTLLAGFRKIKEAKK